VKLELGAVFATLIICLLSVPPVRGAVFGALPDIDDDKDCRNVVCGDGRQGGSAPDIKMDRR